MAPSTRPVDLIGSVYRTAPGKSPQRVKLQLHYSPGGGEWERPPVRTMTRRGRAAVILAMPLVGRVHQSWCCGSYEVRSRSVRSRWHPAFRRTAACADDICIPRAGVWTEILTQLLCRWVIKCPDEGAGGIFCHVECPDVGLRIGRLRVPVPSCL